MCFFLFFFFLLKNLSLFWFLGCFSCNHFFEKQLHKKNKEWLSFSDPLPISPSPLNIYRPHSCQSAEKRLKAHSGCWWLQHPLWPPWSWSNINSSGVEGSINEDWNRWKILTLSLWIWFDWTLLHFVFPSLWWLSGFYCWLFIIYSSLYREWSG